MILAANSCGRGQLGEDQMTNNGDNAEADPFGVGMEERGLEDAMIDRIDHIVMNCRDVATTASWYERALGFKREVYTSGAEPGNGSRSNSGGTSLTSGRQAARGG